ncbi:MAG: hypothetical protein ACRCZD_18820 [Phycicoccus sp.]
MAGGSDAVAYATRLGEIKFVEFTTKLVSDVFDALVAADIRQQQAFVELVKATSTSLTTYINDTKDDIGPAEILQLLSAAAPPTDPDAAEAAPSKVVESGASLTAAEATALNGALEVKDAGVADDNKVASGGALTAEKVDKIKEAAAVRIAANKYTLLKEMVRLGMLRLVVNDGTIETGLNFHSYGSDYFSKNESTFSRSDFEFRARAATGGLLSGWVKASASTAYTSVNVSTSNTSQGSGSGADITITGGVKINFATDYLPVSQS